MDVLAGRKTGGLIQGDIRIQGHPKDQASFARVSGYVEQNDIHSPQTTVREALQFSAHLRLPAGTDPGTVEDFVNQVPPPLLTSCSAARSYLVACINLTLLLSL